LDSKCKIYEENRKTGKENKKKEKYEKAPGEPLGPIPEAARGPPRHFPNRYTLFPFPPLMHGPHMAGHVTLLLPLAGDHAGDRALPADYSSSKPINTFPI
jgi:hypothetical protein